MHVPVLFRNNSAEFELSVFPAARLVLRVLWTCDAHGQGLNYPISFANQVI